jgi:HEAT repeat protein
MGWDVAIWGTLELHTKGIAAWRRTVVDGSACKDWKLWFKNAPPGEPRTAQKHLDEWAKFSAKGHEFLEVRDMPGGVAIEGFVSKETFVERAQQIAALFRVADQQKARGEVYFVGVGGGDFAYRLRLDGKGKSKLEAQDEEELEMAPEAMAILRKMSARLPEAKKGKGAPKPKPAAPSAEGPAMSGDAAAALAEVRRRIESAKPADVAKAAAGLPPEVAIVVSPRPMAVTTAFPTTDMLIAGLTKVDGLSGEEAASRDRAAIRLLAKLDPAAAEPLAIRLLGADSPLDTRWGAAFALAGAKSDAAVEALMSAFTTAAGKADPMFGYSSYLRRGAEVALIATGRSDACDRLVAMLTDDLLDVGKNAPAPSDEEGLDRMDKVAGIFRVLGKMRCPGAWDRVEQIVRTHPSRGIRETAAEALLFMADPRAIKAAFGEAPQAFFKKFVVRGHMYPVGPIELFNRSHAEASAKKLIAAVKASKKAK